MHQAMSFNVSVVLHIFEISMTDVICLLSADGNE